MKAPGGMLRHLKTGANYGIRRSRYRRYWSRAAGVLARAFGMPGKSSEFEAAVFRAVKVAGRPTPRSRVERFILGGMPASEFRSMVDRVAQELPDELRREFPDLDLPPEYITMSFGRAVLDVVAASENDEFANQVLEQGDSAVERRKKWRTLTGVVTPSVVTGVGVALFVAALAHRPSGVALAAGAGIATVAAIGGAQLVRDGAHVSRARGALERLIDALLRPVVAGYRPRPDRERVFEDRIDDQLSLLLEDLAERGFGNVKQPTGPPRRRAELLVAHYDGPQIDAIAEAAEDLADELRPLKLDPTWPPARLLVDVAVLVALQRACAEVDPERARKAVLNALPRSGVSEPLAPSYRALLAALRSASAGEPLGLEPAIGAVMLNVLLGAAAFDRALDQIIDNADRVVAQPAA